MPLLLAVEMKIESSADIQSEFWFYPVYNAAGGLAAFVLHSQLTRAGTEVLLSQLDEMHRMWLLQRQISLIESNAGCFTAHNINIILPLDYPMVQSMLISELLVRRIKQLSFLLLDIDESFPQLSLGKNDPLLASLAQQFRLSLSRFGAGQTTANAVYDNLFSCLRLDEKFIHALARRSSFQAFTQSIVDNFRSHSEGVIISGIDNEEMLANLSGISGSLIQGRVFPAIAAHEISTWCPVNPAPEITQPV